MEHCEALQEQLDQQLELTQQQQDQLQNLEDQVEKAFAEADVYRSRCDQLAEDLDAERAEVERLNSSESSLRQTLDCQCQQLVDSARQQDDLLARIHELEEELAERNIRDQQLQDESQSLQAEMQHLQDTLEASTEEAKLWKERAEALVRRRFAATQTASRWEGADAAWDWLLEKGNGLQGIQDLPEDAELRLQNRELCLSLRQFKMDCELLEAENLSLKEAVNIVEQDLHNVSDQHAQLIGHVNHRQKIRYTMKLKDENNRLCMELKKARQRIIHLEVNRETESLLEALASLGSLLGRDRSPPPSARCEKSVTTPQTSRSYVKSSVRKSPVSTNISHPARALKGSPAYQDFEDQIRLEEAERRAEFQQRALERISVDFQHLKALMERAVLLADTERRNGCHAGNFAALLQRLRDLIAANHRQARSKQATSPEGISAEELAITTQIGDDDSNEEMINDDHITY